MAPELIACSGWLLDKCWQYRIATFKVEKYVLVLDTRRRMPTCSCEQESCEHAQKVRQLWRQIENERIAQENRELLERWEKQALNPTNNHQTRPGSWY